MQKWLTSYKVSVDCLFCWPSCFFPVKACNAIRRGCAESQGWSMLRLHDRCSCFIFYSITLITQFAHVTYRYMQTEDIKGADTIYPKLTVLNGLAADVWVQLHFFFKSIFSVLVLCMLFWFFCCLEALFLLSCCFLE